MSITQKVIGIDCSFSNKILEIPFRENDNVNYGDIVVFKDAENKEEFGVIKYKNVPSVDSEKILFTSKILRIATPNDIQKVENHLDQSRVSLNSCRKLIKKHNLAMNVFRSTFSFDGSKVLFMFTADERIDFRELVKDLAKTLQKQIYLRQIGPRDKAKIVSGYGKCGRELCCSTFLGKLESISMEMVRIQSLESKGSSKLSGACGKLLCCLKYEVEAYKTLKKTLPYISAKVIVKKGSPFTGKKGTVIALDILNQKVKLYIEEGGDIYIFDVSDIKIIPKNK